MDSQEYADYLFNLKEPKRKSKKSSGIIDLVDYYSHYDRSINSVVEYMNIGGIFTQVSIVK